MAEHEPRDEAHSVDDPAAPPTTGEPGAAWHAPEQPCTIHENAGASHELSPGGGVAASVAPADPAVADLERRRGPDPVALVAGMAALVLAALAMTGLLGALDPRWVLAVSAVAVGGTVLLTSLRRS